MDDTAAASRHSSDPTRLGSHTATPAIPANTMATPIYHPVPHASHTPPTTTPQPISYYTAGTRTPRAERLANATPRERHGYLLAVSATASAHSVLDEPADPSIGGSAVMSSGNLFCAIGREYSDSFVVLEICRVILISVWAVTGRTCATSTRCCSGCSGTL
jgi:hypothetical protein